MQLLPVDYLFSGATIITMDAEKQVILDGAIATKDSRILWVGSQEQIPAHLSPAHRVDVQGKVIIPGMINAHGHWAMTLFRGLVDDRPLESWLETIWKVEGAFTSPENVVAGAELAMIEMIRSGTTCAADMYWQFHQTTEAARRAGFRMINGPAFTQIAGFEGQNSIAFEGALEYLDMYKNDPLIHLCIQTHSTYTTNLDMLADARQIMEQRDLLFITHASESRSEVETVQKIYGKTPIEVLDSVGLLGQRTLLAHCVHLSDKEIDRLAETKTSVVHCPSSNLKLSSGIARVAQMLKAGVNVSLGTDGAASNNDLNLFHEAQLAAMVQKGVTGDPTVLPAEKTFSMLTIDAARAVGLDDILGSIETGKLADLVFIDFDSANLTPCYDIFSHLIYAIAASDVCDVMINGKMVMKNRQVLSLDEPEVKAKVRSIAQHIRLL